jgi:hypothetical protein
MIADQAGPLQIHQHNIPGNLGLASLPPGTPGAAPLRPASDERVRHRLLETELDAEFCTNDDRNARNACANPYHQ